MRQDDPLAEHLALVATLGVEERGLARKRRLYLAGLCRRFWEEMPLSSGKTAIERAEAFADGQVTAAALAAAQQAHLQAHVAYSAARGKRVVQTRAGFLSGCALEAANPSGCRLVVPLDRDTLITATHLLRDVFGPIQPQSEGSAAWRTPQVVDMARSIYRDEAFERLPYLAEALTDNGCEDAGILSHCRAPGPHIRGCWVVDQVLGWG